MYTPVHTHTLVCINVHTYHMHADAHTEIPVISCMRADQERRGLTFILQVKGSH